MRRVHVVVTGRVQGVGFRWSTQEEARRLGLTGWVRNRLEGTVEVEAEGPAEAVAELVGWLRNGPRWARVTRIQVRDIPAVGGVGFATRGDG